MEPKPEVITDIQEYPEGNFFKGLFFGVMLCIPLWVSFFGWIKIISSFLS